MQKYEITTDSNSDLPVSYAEKFQTVIIPQYYAFGEEVYGDEKHMPPAEFYERMKKGELPSSMANNPAVIREKFERILKDGNDILHIAFSSALSGSYNNVYVTAQELCEEYPDRKIVVLDSLNVSLAETILVIKANQLRKEGKTLEENAAYLEEYKKHLHVQFTVDDLFHLKRGGRISGAVAAVGTALNLKPFLYVGREGTLVSDGTTRGRKKSIRTLAERVAKTLGDAPDRTVPVGIVHGNCPEDAGLAAEFVKELTGIEDIIINDISPSIGTHAGPGALGILYYGEEKKI
ncbi:DegV family protein [Eisenbergiella porci]|uniref:DegV family protein n=1 Tax=Eisenbergiella porci TaxID=2652274 RepID=UPI003A8FE465